MNFAAGIPTRPLQQRLYRLALYWPLRGYLLAFLAVALLAWGWGQARISGEPSAFNDTLRLLLRVSAGFFALLLIIGFLSVLVPWLLALLAFKQRRLDIRLQTADKNDRSDQHPLSLRLAPLWKPVLGQLYFRFLYDKGKAVSPRFSLVRQENWLGYAGRVQEGWYHWPVPGIREYEIDHMIVYFEDIFHFFSLPLRMPVQQSFFMRPQARDMEKTSFRPAQTEDQDVKVDEWRRVQGEWLNYKNFEANDDVRRIVWKIYARNKELVVRTPELLDPYASKVAMYASFYDGTYQADSLPELMQHRCLDFYKTICWTLYGQLLTQGLEVRMVYDQELPVPVGETAADRVAHALSASRWQHEKPLEAYVSTADASLVCVSSLADTKDLSRLLAETGRQTTVVLVRLSQAFRKGEDIPWWQWLWVEAEKEPGNREALSWLLSPTRRQIRQHEASLEKLLQQSGVRYLTV